ncbi:MAG TPA: PEPxxWA-CTERM sorting domain-containing protein [Phenylobacterium sp.]|nr:PEPxxWA-CTERM sorting domain-containing protein [Phenylobacterium sp.]
MKLAAGAAALAMMLGAAQAQAAIVNWTLSDGTFKGGGTFSGTFTVDTASDTITAWDITSSGVDFSVGPPGSTGTIAYQNAGPPFDFAFDAGSGPTFDGFVVPFFVSVFNLTNIPLAGPGSVAHLTGDESVLAFGVVPVGSHTVTDGQAVGVLAGGVPEPATWSMIILGAGLAGASLRRSRRAAVAA